ncbi:hypothetical protein ACWEO1_06345 [Kitasatospora cineracea]
MSTHTFQIQDRAVIARPEPATPYPAGEPVTVLHVPAAVPAGAAYPVKAITDQGGIAIVWSTELDPA